jgi:hypothetical protein
MHLILPAKAIQGSSRANGPLTGPNSVTGNSESLERFLKQQNPAYEVTHNGGFNNQVN